MKSKSQGPIGLAIAGLGRAGWDSFVRELENRKDKFRIVAVCDVVSERMRLAASQLGCATYERVEDMVADPAVELLGVATRSDFHFPHAVIGLKAGKHVFLEKPITVDHAQARKLQLLDAKSKGTLFVRHNSRYNPVYRRIQEIVDGDLLGEVFEIKVRWNRYSRRDDWQTMRRYGGGIMAQHRHPHGRPGPAAPPLAGGAGVVRPAQGGRRRRRRGPHAPDAGGARTAG